MMRWPTCAIFSLTPAPIAATTPQGSWPPMTGFGLTGSPPIASPPDFGRRYWCRSLPHMPDAFISTTTSPGPGVGSGNSISSISRSPLKTTPRIASSTFLDTKREEPAYALSDGDDMPARRRLLARDHLAVFGEELHQSVGETDPIRILHRAGRTGAAFRAG